MEGSVVGSVDDPVRGAVVGTVEERSAGDAIDRDGDCSVDPSVMDSVGGPVVPPVDL